MANVYSNLEAVCRLCLSASETLIDIFENSSLTTSDVPLLDKIWICLSVEVVAGEKLPSTICQTCVDLVNRFHEFWVATKSTQLKLTSLQNSDEVKSNPARNADKFEVPEGSSTREGASSSQVGENSRVSVIQLQKQESHKMCVDCGVHRSDSQFKLPQSKTPCDLCSQTGASKSVEKITRKYECSVCDYKNASLSNFKIHMLKHDGRSLASCGFCGRGFYSKRACEDHESSKHGDSSFRCSQCQATYHSKAYLRQHVKTHDPNYKTEDYQCEFCGKTYSSWKGVKRHKMIHHFGQSYQCEICDKEVKSLESLNNHRKIHVGDKPYVCSTCGKTFRTRSGLNVHERIHTGAKPFKCRLCDRGFSQTSSLKVHLRYHNGERPYECGVCDKKYVTATLLKKHEKTHEQENLTHPK